VLKEKNKKFKLTLVFYLDKNFIFVTILMTSRGVGY